MSVGGHLSATDIDRIHCVFEKFDRLGFTDYALTGGLALEASLSSGPSGRSTLNDIDLIAPDFHTLPAIFGDSFLIHHAHPKRPKGKLILQLACPDTSLRVDIFSASGAMLTRTRPAKVRGLSIRAVTLEDMASRIVYEMMSLVRGEAISAKCSADYKRLARAINPALAEIGWQEQRRDIDPASFREACAVIDKTLCTIRTQLADPTYAKTFQICPHCTDSQPFTLAAPEAVFDLLGYY
jgi:hypothetical protein